MSKEKEDAINFIANLISELESRPHIRIALLNELREKIAVITKADLP